jgi:hypothetical protein
MLNKVLDAIMSAEMPVADKPKNTTLAAAIPAMTKVDLLKPFEAASAVTAIAAGPGDSTTTKVVAINNINVSSGIIVLPKVFS